MRDETRRQTVFIGRVTNPNIPIIHLREFLVALTVWLTLCSGCVAALPAVIVATSNRVAIEYDPKEGVDSTAALAEEICSEAGGRAQLETSEGSVAKYTCVPLIPTAADSSTARTQTAASTSTTMVATTLPATATCNSVLSAEKMSLSGFLILHGPLTSAKVRVTDRSGHQLAEETVRVSRGGFFHMGLATPLPEAFRVQARVTTSPGDTASTSATLRADVEHFHSGNLNSVILTPVTTLVTAYRDRHTGLEQVDAIHKVNRFLGISPRVDPGGPSAFSTVYFSPQRFWEAAEKSGGFDRTMAQLVAEIDREKGKTRTFAETDLSSFENRVSNGDERWWHLFKKPTFWSAAGFVGNIVGTILDRQFQKQTVNHLKQISTQLDILERKMDELIERIEDLALRNQYETRALILETAIDRDIRAYEVRMRRLIEENNEYVEEYIDNGETNSDIEDTIACEAKEIAKTVKDSTDKALQQIHTVLMGGGQSGPSLTTLWSTVSVPKRFIGDPYFLGLDEQFGYYQTVQADATYFLREAYEEGIPDDPQPSCDPDHSPKHFWMCLHIERSDQQETLLGDRTMFGKLIPKQTVWDRPLNRMWTARSIEGCEAAWSTHRDSAAGFDRGDYTDWRVASKEDYENLLSESEDGKGDMRPEDQPAWDYLNARGFALQPCGLQEHTNTRGYYSSTVSGDRAWVLGVDGGVELRCKQGDCGKYPYQEPWISRGALFNRFHRE